jgi:hypothetical protein
MTVMQNVTHHAERAAVSERNRADFFVRDGVYDHKAYTEKSLARIIKAKAQAERCGTSGATRAAVCIRGGIYTFIFDNCNACSCVWDHHSNTDR